MNAAIAARIQDADAAARVAVAREQLIGMGHTRAEIAQLPDSWVVRLVESLTAEAPPAPAEARCPYCGALGAFVGHIEDVPVYQCHAASCEVGGSYSS